MSAPAVLGSVITALAEQARGHLERIEQQNRQILEALKALVGAGGLAPVSLDVAAPALGKSVATLRRLAAAGKLPGAIRIGRSWRVDLGAVRPATPETISELAEAARR